MNTMMELATSDSTTHTSSPSFAPSATRYQIKRSGGRPLTFEGSELAMAMSYSPAIPFWYEVNLYRTVEQGFVTAIRLFYQSEDRKDTVRAWQSQTLDEAMAQLTEYDAAYDVKVALDFDLLRLSPAETAAQALQLATEIADYRHHYQSLIGEFLYELEFGQT